MTNKSGTSPQIVSLPQGGGALQGIGEKFSPDLHTGTGNFTVPIALPPGRNGFQPQLSLAYSTGSGNGPFGLGWSLGVPGVSRRTSKGVPRYDGGDVFVLSGAEDLVPFPDAGAAAVTRYHPRTEGLFARIQRHRDRTNDYWEVASKDGLVSTYGTQGAAGQDPAAVADPAERTKVFAWKLIRTEDPFGNLIAYEYLRDRDTREPRWRSDQLYLKRIRYLDYTDQDKVGFLISVDFDYGDGDETRPDPFSDHRAGFEIRTRRRCRRIVVRTHADEVARARVDAVGDRWHEAPLVRAYELTYLDERVARGELPGEVLPPNGVSLLSRVRVIGHDESRAEPGERTQALPPLEFGYTRFEPRKRTFAAVQGDGLPAHSLASADLEVADLFGNGLPCLFEMNGTVRYWRNLGGGQFALPRAMADAPAGLQLADQGVQLVDANGDARPDLLVTTPTLSGYYPLRFGGLWDRRSFQPYRSAPSFNLEDPEVKLVDLDGDGVTDALRSGTTFECFYNDPVKGGWHKVERKPRRGLEEFPNVNFSDPRVKWGDLSGDGLQDVALVHDGSVEYWPNLGHGNWGPRVRMRNCPRYPYGYDPKRVLVGDVDGDGLADIVYVDDRRVTLWLNQGGSRWSDPVVVQGTPAVSDTDAVRLLDLRGSGVSGILWSADANGLARDRMFFLDLTGDTKPYLLSEMDNRMGAVTRVSYAPSTQFYLADEARPETRWRTPLPFPVQVVAKVEVEDTFSGGRLTTEYTYHQGYWDGAEREFRGFGLVEQRDSEVFEDFARSNVRELVERVHFSPPVLTKTWFHQGPSGDELGGWEEADPSPGFWPGDAPLLPRPQPVADFLHKLPPRARRDALRALRGSVLRTELYALDGSGRAARPYTVTESTYGVCEVVPDSGGHRLACGPEEAGKKEDSGFSPRVFFPHVRAQRTTPWERGDDPLTVFTFTGDHDNHGQPRQKTMVAMPRRPSQRRKVIGTGSPQEGTEVDETRILATHTRTAYAVPDGDRHIHDRVAEVHGFEFAQEFFWTESDPEDVSEAQRVAATTARTMPELFQEKLKDWTLEWRLPDGLRLAAHTRNHFDGGPSEAFQGRPVGEVGPYGALTRSESLAFTDAGLDGAYRTGDEDRRPRYLDGTADLPAGAPAGFGADLGYCVERPFDVYLRMDGSAVAENGAPGGVVDCQDRVGDWERFELVPQGDGTVGIASVGFPGLYLRMDGRAVAAGGGPGGVVNCQNSVGLWETFRILDQGDGTVAIAWGASRDKGPSRYYTDTQRRRFDFQAEQVRQERGLVLATRDPLSHETTIGPDRYWILPETVRDAAGLETRADYDYRVLQPRQVTDPNGNRTLYAFTPLGLLASIAAMGKEDEETGDSAEVPGTRFAYDLLAYETLRQPVSVRTIRRVRHVHDTDAPPPERDETIKTVELSDGFGRLLQTRAQGEDLLLGDEVFGGGVLPADQNDEAGTLQPVRPGEEDSPVEAADLPGTVAITAAGGKLFAVTQDGRLWARDRDPPGDTWHDVGRADEADGVIAITAVAGMLFAVTSTDSLLVREPVLHHAEWQQAGGAGGVVLLAATNGRLFGIRADGHLSTRPASLGSADWQRIERHYPDRVAFTASDGILYTATGGASATHPSQLWANAAELGPTRTHLVGDSSGAIALAAADGRLYAIDGEGRMSVRGTIPRGLEWHLIGSSGSHPDRADGRTVALAAADGRLFAVTERNRLLTRPGGFGETFFEGIDDIDPDKIGDARVVALAATAGHLFVVTDDDRLLMRPVGIGAAAWVEVEQTGDRPHGVRAFIALDNHLFAVAGDGRLKMRPTTLEAATWEDIGDGGGAKLLATADGYLYALAKTLTGAAEHDRVLRVRTALPAAADWQDSWYDAVNAYSDTIQAVTAVAALGDRLYLVDDQDRLWFRARPDAWEPLGGEPVRYHRPVVVSGWQTYDNKGRVIEKYEPFFSRGWDYRSPATEHDAHGRNVLGTKAILYYDPRGQLIRTVNPDGSEQRVIFGRPDDPTSAQALERPDAFLPTPWESYAYDANDLAPLSCHPTDKLPDGSAKPLTDGAPAAHHFTPASTVVDALGRVLCRVERNGPAPATDWFLTPSVYDLRGNVLSIRDALGREAFRYAYDLLNRRLGTVSIDAGWRTMVADAVGNAVEYRDSRNSVVLRKYDVLNRLVELWALEGEQRNDAGARLSLRERIAHGDSGTADQPVTEREEQRRANRLGRQWRHFDEAGLLEFDSYDCKGNLVGKTRRVVSDTALGRDGGWTAAWEAADGENALDGKLYQTAARYDALNRPVEVLYPEDVEGKRTKLEPRYNGRGALERVALDGELQVERIAYDAKGQRVLAALSNGVMTRYAYDPLTFRLARLRSERFTHPGGDTNAWQGSGSPLQDFAYGYDLAGNITSIQERTPGCGITDSPDGRDRLTRAFSYDPVYRLNKADGRACSDIGAPRPFDDAPRCGFYGPGGPTAPNQNNAPNLTERYTETYRYDAAGNLEELRYLAGRQWTRTLNVEEGSNRLESVTQDGTTFSFAYDPNGNLLRQSTERHHAWDRADRLIAFAIRPDASSPASVDARYLYGADGVRVKKWVRNQAGTVESTVYADRVFEHHRWQDRSASGENNTLQIMDGQQRIASLRLGPAHPDDKSPFLQYHLGDHLGSSHVVMNGGGEWINREEYFPCGQTSFGSFARKRYRFTGREREEESGLYYQGLRYYMPWLARWLSCDPTGPVDDLNLYQYALDNPMTYTDPTGAQAGNPLPRAQLELTIDHVEARARGGSSTDPANLQIMRGSNNFSKGARVEADPVGGDPSKYPRQSFTPQSLAEAKASGKMLEAAQNMWSRTFAETDELREVWNEASKGQTLPYESSQARFWQIVDEAKSPSAELVREAFELGGAGRLSEAKGIRYGIMPERIGLTKVAVPGSAADSICINIPPRKDPKEGILAHPENRSDPRESIHVNPGHRADPLEGILINPGFEMDPAEGILAHPIHNDVSTGPFTLTQADVERSGQAAQATAVTMSAGMIILIGLSFAIPLP